MSAPMIRGFLLFTFCLNVIPQTTGRVIKPEQIPLYRKKVEAMFHHAYDGYIKYAYPYDELRPLTCDGHDTWGSYSLTLIDALDMLAIMGNYTEFRRVADLVADTMEFDEDINVSVFETNIRVVGGLVSAHLFYKKAGMPLESGWPCSGPLLRLAEDVGRRLLPAFDTATGMPYGTVNLKHGVPKGETTVTCTAGVGTFLIEFGALSKLTGDPIFEKVAMRAMKSLWKHKSTIGLVGNHVDVATGKWTALDSGVGGGIDSYFEYLVKGSIMFQNTELLEMFQEYLVAIEKYLKRDDWYMWAHMTKGSISLPIFTSLDGYWPGIQSMLGDIDKAMKTIHNFHQVWKQFGFLPEFYNIVKNEAHSGREGYPLRPELVEAAMYLYQATKDPYLLEIGVDMIESIEHNTRTKCGYATVKNVNSHMLENRMESFFLAETVKYLYLLFDPDNFIHNTGDHGTVINTPNGQCVIDTGSYIFNTEGHPIDTAALHCCSAEKKEDDLALQSFHDNLDLLTLFGIQDNPGTIQGVKWTKTKKQEEPEDAVDLADALENTLMDSLKKMNIDTTTADKGDKQDDSSTQGQNVNVYDLKNVKITISGTNVKVEDKDDDDEEVERDDTDNDNSDVGDRVPVIPDGTEACDKDGNCGGGEGNKEIYTKTANENGEESDDDDEIKSDNEDESSTETRQLGIEELPVNTQQDKIEIIQTSTATTGHTKKTSSTDAVKDVLQLLKSFTKDILVSSGLSSIKSLHDKLKYYSLYHRHKPELMMCKAQPFYMQYSLMGEMFLDNS